MTKRNLDKFIEKSREAAAEGAVLLRNEKNTLPLDKNEMVSVFGRPMFDYYRSGTGSGGAVTVPYAVNLIDGIRNSGLKINEDIIICLIYTESAKLSSILPKIKGSNACDKVNTAVNKILIIIKYQYFFKIEAYFFMFNHAPLKFDLMLMQIRLFLLNYHSL